MVTKRIDLEKVKTKRVRINDDGKLGSDHYEDVVLLSEVRAIIADANIMLAERDGIIAGLKTAINATYGVGGTRTVLAVGTECVNKTTKENFMGKIYGIRVYQGSLVVRNGKFALYASKELAEQDLHSMPDSWTDYDHYEVVELDVMCSSEFLLFSNPKPKND